MLVPTWIIPFFVVIFSAAVASIGALYRRMAAAEKQMVELRTKIGPYWEVVQQVLSKRLTHHGYPEADALMVKLNAGTLTPGETIILKQFIVERTRDFSPTISASERETAVHFAWIMDQVILSAEGKS